MPADSLTIFEIAQQVARRHGVAELAEQMGKNVGTLYNKLNPADDNRHELTLRDVIQITTITNDNRIVEKLAAMRGLATFHVPTFRSYSDVDLLEALTGLAIENGHFQQAIGEGLADRRFSRAEWERVRAEALRLVGAVMETVSRLETMIDD